MQTKIQNNEMDQFFRTYLSCQLGKHGLKRVINVVFSYFIL